MLAESYHKLSQLSETWSESRSSGSANSTTSLPFELQWMVLVHLDSLKEHQEEERLLNPPASEQTHITNTLKSCGLVCKAWFLICRRFLMKNVRLSSRNHLEDLALSGSSIVGSPFPHIVNLVLTTSLNESNPRPFHHLFPHYFSTKMPSLFRLYIIEDKNPNRPVIFPVPRSITMHLGHFRTLTKLRLVHLQFQSLWDLRRLVISPPSLSSLWLRDVSWPSPFEEPLRVPSLISTPHKLSEVKISECLRHWEIFWVWTTSCAPTTSATAESTSREHTLPAFTTRDTVILSGLVEKFLPVTITPQILWSYREERHSCESSRKFIANRFLLMYLLQGRSPTEIGNALTTRYVPHSTSFLVVKRTGQNLRNFPLAYRLGSAGLTHCVARLSCLRGTGRMPMGSVMGCRTFGRSISVYPTPILTMRVSSKRSHAP